MSQKQNSKFLIIAHWKFFLDFFERGCFGYGRRKTGNLFTILNDLMTRDLWDLRSKMGSFAYLQFDGLFDAFKPSLSHSIFTSS